MPLFRGGPFGPTYYTGEQVSPDGVIQELWDQSFLDNKGYDVGSDANMVRNPQSYVPTPPAQLPNVDHVDPARLVQQISYVPPPPLNYGGAGESEYTLPNPPTNEGGPLQQYAVPDYANNNVAFDARPLSEQRPTELKGGVPYFDKKEMIGAENLKDKRDEWSIYFDAKNSGVPLTPIEYDPFNEQPLRQGEEYLKRISEPSALAKTAKAIGSLFVSDTGPDTDLEGNEYPPDTSGNVPDAKKPVFGPGDSNFEKMSRAMQLSYIEALNNNYLPENALDVRKVAQDDSGFFNFLDKDGNRVFSARRILDTDPAAVARQRAAQDSLAVAKEKLIGADAATPGHAQLRTDFARASRELAAADAEVEKKTREREVFYDKNGTEIKLTRRPNIVPFTVNPQTGRYEGAVPGFLDTINVMPGITSPAKFTRAAAAAATAADAAGAASPAKAAEVAAAAERRAFTPEGAVLQAKTGTGGTAGAISKLVPAPISKFAESIWPGFKSAGLPMDEASRAIRAEKMGFNIDAAHATRYPEFTVFQRAKNDIGMHFGTKGQAQDRLDYTSRVARERGMEAEGDRIMPIKLNIQNPLRLNDLGSWDADNMIFGLRNAGFSGEEIGRALMKARTSTERIEQLRELIKKKGYDGIVYRNTGETSGGAEMMKKEDDAYRNLMVAFRREKGAGHPFNINSPEVHKLPEHKVYEDAIEEGRKFRVDKAEDSYIAFHPNQIRSATAAEFDPWKADSGNILSAKTGAGGSGGAASKIIKYPTALRRNWWGHGDYDRTGGRMEKMTPDEFLGKSRPLDLDETSREQIDLLKEHMLSGKRLDPLMLGRNPAGPDGQPGKLMEDGRHRAVAAKELGIKEVPVINFRADKVPGRDGLINPMPTPNDWVPQLNRKLNRDPDVGAPKNAARKVAPGVWIGDINLNQWKQRTKKFLTPSEIADARAWYHDALGTYERFFGKEKAPIMLGAWLTANVNATPSFAMLSAIRTAEQFVNNTAEFRKQKMGGLAHDKLMEYWDAIKNDDFTKLGREGSGQKIYDFIDSALLKKTRTFYGDDPRAGAPAVADVHSLRDTGFIDDTVIDWVADKYGKQAARGLKPDTVGGGPSETQYEWSANKMRDWTAQLNKEKWGGGNAPWTPLEMQAVGWTAMSKMLGRKAETSAAAITGNIRNLSYELDFGKGAPYNKLFPDWHPLPLEARAAVSKAVLPKILDFAKEITGAHEFARVDGLGGWGRFLNPSQKARLIASPEVAGDVADIVGYLAQQTKVMGYRAVPKGPRIGVMVYGDSLENSDNVTKLWTTLVDRHPDLAAGFSPSIRADGMHGIEIILDKGGAKIAERVEKELVPTIQKIVDEQKLGDMSVDNFRATEESRGNVWNRSKEGQGYLQRLRRRYGPDIHGRLELFKREILEPEIRRALDEAKQPAAKADDAAKAADEVTPPTGGGDGTTLTAKTGAGGSAGAIAKLMENPRFVKFIEGSKVVDKSGNPLPVYHSTTSIFPFKEFNTKRSELGSHFATKPHQTPVSDFERGARTYPVALNLKNPLRLDDLGDFKPDIVLAQLREKGIFTAQETSTLRRAVTRSGGDDEPIKKALEKKGYDGVVYLNRREGLAGEGQQVSMLDWADAITGKLNKMTDEEFLARYPHAGEAYIAFRPNQIKSIIANRGTFDPEKGNILMAKTGTGGGAGAAAKLTAAEQIAQRAELIKSRIRQIEYDRRLSGEKVDGKYPFNHELSQLRRQLWGLDEPVKEQPIEGMTFYHGTNKEFTNFGHHAQTESGRPDGVFMFSPKKLTAENYSTVEQGGSPRVVAAELNLKNPKVMDAEEISTIGKEHAEELKAAGHDGVIYRDPVTGEIVEAGVFDSKQIKQVNPVQKLMEANTERLMQDPKFARFVEGTTITEPSGLPRVMFHGTPAHEGEKGALGGFDVFDRLAVSKTMKGRRPAFDAVGSWFSSNPTEKGAGLYSGTGDFPKTSPQIYPVYLNIKNPWEPKSFTAMVDKMNELAGRDMTPVKKGLFIHRPVPGDVSPEPMRAWLKEQGYDGIRFKEKDIDGGDHTVVVALEPNQIKSATGNSGEFDPTNASIIRSESGTGGGAGAVSKLTPDLVQKFTELAHAQRYKPEKAMDAVQAATGGSNISWMVEHTGDLIHRMTEMAKYNNAGFDAMKEKVPRLIRTLEDGYGFERDMKETLIDNARHRGTPLDEFHANVDKAMKTYVEEHKKLPTYNRAQELAQEAAVSLGEGRYKDTLKALKEIDSHLDTPQDWEKFAFEVQSKTGTGGAAGAASKVAPPFYSALERAVETLPMKSATADQWLATLKQTPGIKKEEMDWRGINKFLEERKAPGRNDTTVTREELQDVLKQNDVQIKTVELHDRDKYSRTHPEVVEEAKRQAEDWAESFEQRFDRKPSQAELDHRVESHIDDIMADPEAFLGYQKEGGTKWGEWRLFESDIGKNYSETIITMPPETKTVTKEDVTELARKILDEKYAKRGSQMASAAKYERMREKPEEYGLSGWYEAAKQLGVDADEVLKKPQVVPANPNDVFKAKQHWGEIENPIVHTRHDDHMMDAPGFAVVNKKSGNASQVFDTKAEAEAYQAKLPEKVRSNTKIENEGAQKKTMLIHEMQSDLHQAGRKSGYGEKGNLDELRGKALAAEEEARAANRAAMDAGKGFGMSDSTLVGLPGRIHWDLLAENGGVLPKEGVTLGEMKGWLTKWSMEKLANDPVKLNGFTAAINKYIQASRANQEAQSALTKASNLVPDLPFKKNWAELAVKRMIRKAVEEGYDQIAWGRGEDVADMFDLRKQVQNITAQRNADGTYKVSAKALNGKDVDVGSAIKEEKLADHLGKGMADKIAAQKADDTHIYEGDELKAGGKQLAGMVKFYNEMLVNAFNDVGKPFGAKVKEGELKGVLPGTQKNRVNDNIQIHTSDVMRPKSEQTITVKDAKTDQVFFHGANNDENYAKARDIAKRLSVKPAPVFVLPFNKKLTEAALDEGFRLFSKTGAGGAAGAAGKLAPPFFSSVDKAMEAIPMKVGSAEQWMNRLKGSMGVKQEELEWRNVNDFFNERKAAGTSARITRDEIVDHLNKNKVNMEEVTKSQTPKYTKDSPEVVAVVNGHMDDFVEQMQRDYRTIPTQRAMNAQRNYWENLVLANPESYISDSEKLSSRYGKWRVYRNNRGENYREHVFNLPPEDSAPMITRDDVAKRAREIMQYDYAHRGDRMATPDEFKMLMAHPEEHPDSGWYQAAEELGVDGDTIWNKPQRGKSKTNIFTHQHWPGEENTIGHARTDDRIVEGKKTLVLQEVQSDLHQKGSKEGYAPTRKELRAMEDAALQRRADVTKEKDALVALAQKISPTEGDKQWWERMLSRMRFERHGIDTDNANLQSWLVNRDMGNFAIDPRFPEFKEAYGKWADNVMESEVAWDAVSKATNAPPDLPFKTSWTEMIMKRMIRMAAEEGYDQLAWAPGEAVADMFSLRHQIRNLSAKKNADGTYMVQATSIDGDSINVGDAIKKEKLEDHVGKGMAQKIVKQDTPEIVDYTGDDLEPVGEQLAGMRNAYSKVMVDIGNKIAKPFGVKVETKMFDEKTTPVWGVFKHGTEERVWPDQEFSSHTDARNAILRADMQGKGLSVREIATKPDKPLFVLPINDKLKEVALGEGFSMFSKTGAGGAAGAATGVEGSNADEQPDRPDPDDPSLYDTQLSPEEEESFTKWKEKNAPDDSGEDYDLRGAFKEGLLPGEDEHWSDKYKKPNHPTFSNESRYAEEHPDLAGHWEGDTFYPAQAFGMPLRQKLFPKEEEFFRANPHVTGMAADDGMIVVNPHSRLSPVERRAVVQNEAARLFMREKKITPGFRVTPEQQQRFADTDYGQDQTALRETIAARILSGDPSAEDATEEQRAFVEELLRPSMSSGKMRLVPVDIDPFVTTQPVDHDPFTPGIQ